MLARGPSNFQTTTYVLSMPCCYSLTVPKSFVAVEKLSWGKSAEIKIASGCPANDFLCSARHFLSAVYEALSAFIGIFRAFYSMDVSMVSCAEENGQEGRISCLRRAQPESRGSQRQKPSSLGPFDDS